MSTNIYPGRYTADTNEDFVVFLIGMRINKFWQVRSWLAVSRAMGPMMKQLYEHPEKGFLGGENFFNGRTTRLLSYWRSFEDLERFARNPADPHLSAWQMFRKNIGDDGSVGIWHETYQVKAGQFESFYGNMPRFGLAKAFGHQPVTRGLNSARKRMGGTDKMDAREESPVFERG